MTTLIHSLRQGSPLPQLHLDPVRRRGAALYLAGSVPLSAQLGNAISNDGDALFPVIAVAPKAALLATLYSALPAFAVAYGWYWLVE